MATVSNTLYPPAISSQMPAFIYNKEATVYFSVSSFDNPDDIAYVHVSVVDQKTNKNVLVWKNGTSSFYPAILPYAFSDVTNVSDNTYKLTIPATVIGEKGQFTPNQFYKVQIRFQMASDSSDSNPCEYFSTSKTEYSGNPSQNLNNLLNNCKQYFSEWSTVCLIRPIYNPEIFYTKGKKGLGKFIYDGDTPPIFVPGDVRVSGFLDFYDDVSSEGDYSIVEKSTEKLKCCYISVVKNSTATEAFTADGDDEEVYIEEIEYYPDGVDKNSINTIIDIKSLQDGNTSISEACLKIRFVTTNNYTFSRYFTFKLNKTTDSGKWTIKEFNKEYYQEEDENNELVNKSFENEKTAIAYAETNNISYLNIEEINKQWYILISKESNLIKDNDNGVIIIPIEYYNSDDTYLKDVIYNLGTLHVYRSSSTFNFEDRDEIATFELNNDRETLEVIDNTVGSLTGYRYSVQYENAQQLFYAINETENIYMLDYYGALFSRQDKILKVSFDFNASQLTPTVNRTMFTTLGSKYPKFAENAIINYKKYSISGKISSQDDDGTIYTKGNNKDYSELSYDSTDKSSDNISYINSFTTKKETIGENFYDYYYETDTNGCYKIWDNWLPYNDYMWEREYRSAVIEWLNDGEPKLFRSMTEGNMVVILNDISLTPTNGLNRRLWDFSATMYEIENGYDIEILKDYGIYNYIDETESDDYETSESSEVVSTTIEHNISQTFSFSNYNKTFCDFLKDDKSSKFVGIDSGSSLSEDTGSLYLQNVKIQFLNKPHILIKNTSGNYEIAENNIDSSNYIDSYYGYYIVVTFYNEMSADNAELIQEFFINDKGYIQFPSELKILDISFPFMKKDNVDNSIDKVMIDYIATYKINNDTSKIKRNDYILETIVGQEYGTYKSGVSIGKNLYKKHIYTEYSDDGNLSSIQQLNYWEGVSIESLPYTKINIIYNEIQNEKNIESEYIIGETGILDLNNDIDIYDIIPLGKIMFKATDPRFMQEHEFYEYKSDTEIINTAKIKNPRENWVYTINKNDFIYKNGNYYSFSKEYYKKDGKIVVYKSSEGAKTAAQTMELKDYSIKKISDEEYYININPNVGIAKTPSNIILNYTGYITKEVY